LQSHGANQPRGVRCGRFAWPSPDSPAPHGMSTKLASPDRGSPKPSWLGAQNQLAFASRQLSWFKVQEGARGLVRRLMLRPGRFAHRRSPLLRAFLLPVVILLAAALLESWLHRRRFVVPMPTYELDAPFYTACQEPDVDEPRENAALVMLARNTELAAAQHTIQSIERHFNRWFHYPVIFLNDEEWSAEFIATMNATVSGGAQFHVVPRSDWTFPSWLDQDAAKASIAQQAKDGILYAGLETYHHMCRFFSGKFYMLDVLKNYKWYWRLEPDVDFHCAITYDPFVEMAKNNKMYGYTIALNEVRNTCPSLFRKIADWKEEHRIGTSSLWKATVMASWLPWPFRTWLRWLPHRDRFGDMWSSCHYWSNFEIADLDFFRSKEYQDLFEYLDKDGGFYFERVGTPSSSSMSGI
jgi:mannosyltransferase